MDLDVVMLSRVQFALTVMFHYLFPPLTIGLGVVLAFLLGMRLKTGDARYEAAAKFWTGIFALNFAMGVATGIVMEFQFGTNWSTYSRFVGDVFGSALAAEGIFAFFLESGFLGVLVFGWNRVSPRMHFFAALMVAVGGIFSAVWIVVANSWQQTPAGFHLVGEGDQMRAEITDFWAMVFNPSSVHRLVHVIIGSFILGSFFVLSVSAWYLLRGKHIDFAKRSFSAALVLALLASLAAPISGHFHAQQVAETQPAKLAAMEGHFETGDGPAPLHLFGIPDQEAGVMRYGLAIPAGLSFLVHEDFETPVTGLNEFPRDEWPPVLITFASFHIMVGLGVCFIGLTLLAAFFRLRGTLFEKRWLLWIFVFAILGTYVANMLGWMTAEVGRQPWVVYGLLKTEDGVSKSVKANAVLSSIIMFGLLYTTMLALFLYILNEKIQKGPQPLTAATPEGGGALEAAAEHIDPARRHAADL